MALTDGLNPQQHAAVTLPDEHALVLAGAGSGKTRVLTTRIAWLISERGCRPADVLAVTFTNKAAREMQTRLGALLPLNTRSMWIGTFHGLCNRLLRVHHRDAGLMQTFQILDSADQLAAIKRLLKAQGVDDRQFPPRELMWFINHNKESGLRPHQVSPDHRLDTDRIALYERYQAQCEHEGVVDFAELLLRTFELLTRNAPLRAHYQARFRHVLVDEFQDTNVLQYRWLKLMAGVEPPVGEGARPAAMFCVGDDDQSIYRFRGADVRNMRAFEHECAGHRVVRLEQNYRSYGNILDAANAIIRGNLERLGKSLWTDRGAGEPIRLVETYGDLDEARWIVDEIRQLVDEGHSRDQIALLYRSNAQSRVLEQCLFAAGVPYRVYGGLRFFERQEIKHALAYLRLIASPDDDSAFIRVVNFPARGIGARTLEQLQLTAADLGGSLFAAIPHQAGKGGASLARFAALLASLRAATAELPLDRQVDVVLDLSGLRDHYRNDKDGQDRLENLDELVSAARRFVDDELNDLAALGGDDDPQAAAPSHGPLVAFLTHAALEAGEHQADAQVSAVQLMTIHAAKGLEFDVVFVGGLEEGLFPHENSLVETAGLEEERRLMYVAVTRARQRLYLTNAQSRMLHGQTRYSTRSRFVDEIPAALVRQLGVRETRDAGVGSWRSASVGRHAAVSAPVVPRASAVGGLRIGQLVAHRRFGQGVVLAAEGQGKDARVQVNFGAAGIKWLLLEVAKLTPVESDGA